MDKLKKPILIVLLAVVFVSVLEMIAIIGFGVYQTTPSKADAVIVLGARVGTPALTERTLKGLQYYRQTNAQTLVLSGSKGSDEAVSEAQAMKDVITKYIVKNGGDMPNIILEDKSVDTFQNIHFSKDLIPNAKNIVVVSDVYHLARAFLIAKRDGANSVYWGAPKPSYYSNIELAKYYIREAIATVVYLPKIITNS